MRAVIIAGGTICDPSFYRPLVQADDFVICADSGYINAAKIGITPKLVIGDFDSSENPCLDVETIVLPCEKDDTDTVFAVKEAIKRGFKDFVLLGVIGQRLDHTLGNVSILKMLFEKGFKALIADEYTEMQIVGEKPLYIDDSYPFFSLLNIFGNAKGIEVKNAKYPLENAEITTDYQYGISNEVIKGLTASVSVAQGRLLLIKVK